MSGPVKVSVILPVYNGARHLAEAIRSVLAQRGVAFELLIGDDASTDDSWEVIAPFRKDPRVRAWRFRTRRGLGGNPNRLRKRARGRYLAIFEQDDRMLPGCLKRLSAWLDRHPAAGVVSGPRRVLDRAGRTRPERKFDIRRYPNWDLIRMQQPHAGTMVRKRAMERIGGYREELKLAVDCDLFLRLAEVTGFGRIGGRPVYLYREWSGSESSRLPSLAVQKRVVQKILREVIFRRYGWRVRWNASGRPESGKGRRAASPARRRRNAG